MMRKFFKEYDQEAIDYLKHRLSQNLILLGAQIHVRKSHSCQVFRVQELTREYDRLQSHLYYVNRLKAINHRGSRLD